MAGLPGLHTTAHEIDCRPLTSASAAYLTRWLRLVARRESMFYDCVGRLDLVESVVRFVYQVGSSTARRRQCRVGSGQLRCPTVCNWGLGWAVLASVACPVRRTGEAI